MHYSTLIYVITANVIVDENVLNICTNLKDRGIKINISTNIAQTIINGMVKVIFRVIQQEIKLEN